MCILVRRGVGISQRSLVSYSHLHHHHSSAKTAFVDPLPDLVVRIQVQKVSDSSQ
jgi:hypothetical protein